MSELAADLSSAPNPSSTSSEDGPSGERRPIGRPGKHRRRWIGLIKFLLLTGVLVFVFLNLRRQWKIIDWSQVYIRPVPLVLSLIALVGVSTLQMISYRSLLSAYATAPAWSAMLAVAWVPPLGKYIPGKIAALVAAMSILRRFAIPASVAVSVVLVLDGLAVLAGLISGLPVLFWEPVRRLVPQAPYVCLPLILCGIVCLWPRVFNRIINLLLRKLGRPALAKLPTLSQYAIPVACAFGQWVLAGLSLFWMVQSVTGLQSISNLPVLISFAALSQTIGYLALFAPGGLGVREGILLAALPPLLGPFAAMAAVIVPVRAIAQIVIDLLLAGVGLVVLRHSDRSRCKSST